MEVVNKENLKNIKNLVFRKATKEDVTKIAELVSSVIGSCDTSNNDKLNSEKEVIEKNYKHIINNFENYYLCLDNDNIVGVCGISKILNNYRHNLDLKSFREISCLVVAPKYQRRGIGTSLLNLCINDYSNCPIIYEGWGDKGYINSKDLLIKLGFLLYRDLGNDYYKNLNYCNSCVNRNKNCTSCTCQLWLKK